MDLSKFKKYRKKDSQLLRPYIPGEDMTGISVSEGDPLEVGGMVGIDPDNTADQWYVSKRFMKKYESAE